jgi:FkbM family methyltransferase
MISYFDKFSKFTKRVVNAAQMGVYFPGTKQFKLPEQVLIYNNLVKINAPQELGLAWDFINVLLDDEYGLHNILPPPATVLDIGANIGLFSLWAARCFPSAIIHAYEPNPRITPFTQNNLDQCGVNLFREAIGYETGFASLIDNSESRLCQLKTGTSEGIAIIQLQEAINRIGGQVDLLKIDCEGAEWDIFRNPEPFKSIKSVRMEYHLTEGRTIEDIKAVIHDLGFTLEHLEENSGFGIVWFYRS